MKIEWHTETRAIADLLAHPKNPRTFTKKGLADLRKSLDRFGLAEPLVVNTDGVIIGGHARLYVLKEQGAAECQCMVPSKALTPKQVDELNIRLNANIAGEWDFDILANEWDADELSEWGVDAVKHLAPGLSEPEFGEVSFTTLFKLHIPDESARKLEAELIRLRGEMFPELVIQK